MSTQPFAIEINESEIRMADARFQDGVVFLQALGSADSVPNFLTTCDTEVTQQKQAQAINALYADMKIKSKVAHVIIPDMVTYAQIIDTPILPEKELITAIRYQADEFIPMRIEDTYLDLEILHEDAEAKKLRILIVAAPKRMVDGVYRTIEFAGLEPQRLETEISAIGRLVSEIMKSRSVKEGYCVLNVGFSGSSLYVIDNISNTLVFHRTCKVGFDLILKEIITNLNMSEGQARALLKEPGEKRADVATSIATSLKELSAEVDHIVEVYTRRYNLPVTHIFSMNFSSYIADFNRLLSAFSSYHVESLPLNTVYVPNPVLKVFSNEISGFASTVSSILL